MKNNNLQDSELIGEASTGHLADTAWGQGRKIKLTSSICPQCVSSIEAQVLERGGEVWMDKSCDQHGHFSALLSADIKHYFEPASQPIKGQSCCGSSCGQPGSAMESMDDSAAWKESAEDLQALDQQVAMLARVSPNTDPDQFPTPGCKHCRPGLWYRNIRPDAGQGPGIEYQRY
jgi:hypothetical protein